MSKTILLTGATDGIGFETAKKLAALGHTVLLHGRSESKLQHAKEVIEASFSGANIDTFLADLSQISQVLELAEKVKEKYTQLDVLINNAGVYKAPNNLNENGFDVRFLVNTIAPYVLTNALLEVMNEHSRVVNLSSAAQASVALAAIKGQQVLSDSAAYAQSKLALTMWSFELAKQWGTHAPSLIAVNPASFLGSKMVKEAYGSEGKDLNIGADILLKAALDDQFAGVTGRYFDNDIGAFANPHPDALNSEKNAALINTMNDVLSRLNVQL
ncbi:SDR family NAD(P)-dependent oxidoreductase [Pseudoalteromonas gelatinilytica]|uniref:Oxidoreductase n=1 Tax=Pseudoalteromonas gelatinilytica TaxID=1703256 RepID=A0ABQ1T5Y9_9GAMM|nr:SDR family NAD(P)-dependent oxidoreductase [Pseudoalteromonas profundi]GGE85622.1 oxidoreductase [Pseudoalteromonas profundi]